MKQIIFILLFFITTCCYGQKKDTNRYFAVMYFGQDTLKQIRYGTYYFSTQNNYLPTIEEVYKIVIEGYKLHFSYRNTTLSLILQEFKNKREYDKFNYPH